MEHCCLNIDWGEVLDSKFADSGGVYLVNRFTDLRIAVLEIVHSYCFDVLLAHHQIVVGDLHGRHVSSIARRVLDFYFLRVVGDVVNVYCIVFVFKGISNSMVDLLGVNVREST